MNVLPDVYGIGKDQHQCRQYLKVLLGDILVKAFVSLQLSIMKFRPSLAQNVFMRKHWEDNRTLVLAATIIRKSVDEMIKKVSELAWPPSVDEIENKSREPPAELTAFLSKLLIDDSHHSIGSTKSRVVRSIADDIIYNVSNGGFLTAKQCTLGLGIQSMTRQKWLIVILSRLGHLISYDEVLEIETAQAEVTEQFRWNLSVLPIQPVVERTEVYSIFKIRIPGNKIHHNLLCISTSPRLYLIKQFLKLKHGEVWNGRKTSLS